MPEEGGGELEDGVDDGGVEGLGPYDPGDGIGWLPGGEPDDGVDDGGVEGLGPYEPGGGAYRSSGLSPELGGGGACPPAGIG